MHKSRTPAGIHAWSEEEGKKKRSRDRKDSAWWKERQPNKTEILCEELKKGLPMGGPLHFP